MRWISRIIGILFVHLAVMFFCTMDANAERPDSFNENRKCPDSSSDTGQQKAKEFEHYVSVDFEDPTREDEYYELINIPGTSDYVCEADLPAGKLQLLVVGFRFGSVINGRYGYTVVDNVYCDAPYRKKLITGGGEQWTVNNWQGGHLKIKVYPEDRTDGDIDYWLELSSDDQPPRPDLGFSDTAYIIGDFNDWQLPDGDSLNGSLPIERTDNLEDLHTSPWYNAYLDFPAGKNRFTVYIPPTESYKGGYVMPASGEQTDIPTSVVQSPNPKRNWWYYEYQYPFDNRPTLNAQTQYVLEDKFDMNRSFRMEKWNGGEVWFRLGKPSYDSQRLFVTPRRYPTFDVVWDIDYVFNGEEYGCGLSPEMYGVSDYVSYIIWGYEELEFPLEGYIKCRNGNVEYVESDFLGVTGQSEFELGPEDQRIYIMLSFSSTKPFKINYTGKRLCRWEYLMDERELYFHIEAEENGLTDVTADTSLRVVGTKAETSLPCEISVYSAGGTRVGAVTGIEYDLSSLAPGIYIIRAAGKTLKVAL